MRFFRELGAAFIMMLFAFSGNAQTLVGLPQFGVALGGTVSNPIIVNASGRDILAYVLHFRDAQGNGPVVPQLTTHHIWNNEPVQTTIESHGAGNFQVQKNPIVKVTLDAVVFNDGEYVAAPFGPVPQQNCDYCFHQLALRIEAQASLGRLVAAGRTNAPGQAGLWQEVKTLSTRPPGGLASGVDETLAHFSQQSLAKQLVDIKDKRGSEEAFNAADRVGKLPKVWRKQ